MLHFHSCRDWLDERKAGKRGAVGERSQEKYEQIIGNFVDYLGERADLPLTAISPRDVRGFRDLLATKRRSAATINQTVRKILTAPFNAAVRLGYLTVNPCAGVEALKDDAEVQREVFTPEQVALLLDQADEVWRGVILAGYFTGLRLLRCLRTPLGIPRPRRRAAEGEDAQDGQDRDGAIAPGDRGVVAHATARHRACARLPHAGRKGNGGRAWALSGVRKDNGARRHQRAAHARCRGPPRAKDEQPQLSQPAAFLRLGAGQCRRARGTAAKAQRPYDRSHARYTHHEVETLRAAVATMPGFSA